jgi:DnaK suppressor protein
MAKNDKLLKVTELLLKRRAALCKRLGMEMHDLGGHSGAGDAADVAFGAAGESLASQMAELESQELAMIELALTRLKQGRYGICDVCEKKIPVARLNAVPYSVMCVKCQEQAEKKEDWIEAHASYSWGDVKDAEPELDFNDVQVDYGK